MICRTFLELKCRMDTTRPFRDYLSKFVELTDTEFEQQLMPVIKVRRYGKKELLEKMNPSRAAAT